MKPMILALLQAPGPFKELATIRGKRRPLRRRRGRDRLSLPRPACPRIFTVTTGIVQFR